MTTTTTPATETLPLRLEGDEAVTPYITSKKLLLDGFGGDVARYETALLAVHADLLTRGLYLVWVSPETFYVEGDQAAFLAYVREMIAKPAVTDVEIFWRDAA